MAARRAVLAVALILVGFLAFLTLRQLFTTGADVLVIVSLGVLAILGFGIFGALSEPDGRG